MTITPATATSGLVGRERELAAADGAIADVLGGESRVLAVLGETGIGKSALLDALHERAAAAGLLVLDGRAAEHERDMPFGLVIDALDDHVATMHPRRVESVGADLAAALPSAAVAGAAPAAPGAGERFRCHRALRALIEMLGRERPVALLLDDLHWADDASIEFVLHLLRRPARAPHLLAFALRPMEPAPRLLHATRAASGQLISLSPLPHAASLELIGHVPDASLRERLAREAAGNPLFLQELARVARDPGGALPPTLLAAVRLEVGAMPPAARALLDGAAVAGDPFDPELAAAAAGIDPAGALAPLDGLVAADLVCATGDGRAFRFRHPLLRRAVYDAAPPAWRLAAHERVAATLATRGAGASVRAFHVEKCARPGDAAAVGVLAEAAAAAANTAPATAARWYAAGARLLPHADRTERAGLLGPMAVSLANAGRLHESREALLDVLALLPSERTPERLAIVARTRRRRAPARPPRRRPPAAAGRARGRAVRVARHARARDGRRRLLRGRRRRHARLGRAVPRATRSGRRRCGPAPRASARSAPSARATPRRPRRCSHRAIDRLARIDDPEIAAGLERRRPRRHRRAAGRALRGRLRDARPRAVRGPRHAPGRPARPARHHPRAAPAAAAEPGRGARRRRGRRGGRPAAGRAADAPRRAVDEGAAAPRPRRGLRGRPHGRRSPPSCSASSRPASPPAPAAARSPRSTRSRTPSAACAS